ncbi:MAG: PAS domain S-box protein [Pseudomonadales bacterium]|nr:PAS domain S-box protein [Pseudomonadales bacterium]
MGLPSLNLTLESVLDNMPSAVLVSNVDGDIVYANEMAVKFLGYSLSELSKMTIHDLVPDRIRPRHSFLQQSYLEAPFQRSLHAGPGNIQVKTRSGELIAVDIALNHMNTENGETRIVSVIQDASVRTSIEHETRQFYKGLSGSQQSQNDLRSLGQDLVWRCDLKGSFTYVNHRWQELLGYEPSSMLGEPLDSFLKPCERTRAGGEFNHLLREGSQITGFKTVFFDKKNEEVHLLFNAKLIKNNDDVLTGIQGTATDITQLQLAEKERQAIEERLLNIQKHEALGRLVGGIAHDFNNLLHVILGNASLIVDEALVEDKDMGLVDQIMKAADKGTSLVKQLLTFGKPTGSNRLGLDTANAIRQDVNLLEQMCGNNCQLKLALVEDLPLANANAGQFSQVLFNLVLNARDAMNAKGEIQIECYEVRHASSNKKSYGGFRHGAIVLRVIDSGVGMDNKTKQLIFDPFFTTKGPDKGTGLGLSTVFSIVRQSGGEIQVDSEPGKGTTFTLLFPLFQHIDALPFNQVDQFEHLEGSETILLMVAEKSERSYLKRSLSLQGYHILLAENLDHALELSVNKDLVIDLLIIDVKSEKAGGIFLEKTISRDHPNLKTIFVADSDCKIIESDFQGESLAEFLVKPFTLITLLKLTRATLTAQIPR